MFLHNPSNILFTILNYTKMDFCTKYSIDTLIPFPASPALFTPIVHVCLPTHLHRLYNMYAQLHLRHWHIKYYYYLHHHDLPLSALWQHAVSPHLPLEVSLLLSTNENESGSQGQVASKINMNHSTLLALHSQEPFVSPARSERVVEMSSAWQREQKTERHIKER